MAAVLCTLVERAGAESRYWLWHVPETHVCWLIREIDRRMRREAEAARYGSAAPIDPGDPRVKAHKAWRRLVDRLTENTDETGKENES